MGEQYKIALFRDIQYWSQKTCHHEWNEGSRDWVWNLDSSLRSKWQVKLKTIYFGWWTPLLLWSQYLIDIVQEIENNFDISELQELTIECNPYPYQETLISIKHIIQTYSHIPRLRFSFGIQSLDDTILQQSNRDCTFAWLQQFTQDILAIKQSNILYNFDFIAFGNNNSEFKIQNSKLEWQVALDRNSTKKRLKILVHSKTIDSFSLYTLELFAWAKRYHETKDPLIAYQAPWDHEVPFATSEDSILNQFEELKKLFLDGWYSRYEISNYALPWKESIHNQTYRTMGEYLWIWLWAHGFVQLPMHNIQCAIDNQKNSELWILHSEFCRTENTWWRKNYIQWPTEKTYTKKPCAQKDILIESFFLWLRQQSGIVGISKYGSILNDNRQQAINKLVENNICIFNGNILQLTDQGMNIHHQVCTYLMKEI